MLLAIDSGNTHIVFALFDHGKQCGKWRMAVSANISGDDIAIWLSKALELEQYQLRDVEAVIIANVVPKNDVELVKFGKRYCKKCLLVGDISLDFGFNNLAKRTEDVGSDRLVNGVAGQYLYGKPLIVVDFGTATSFDFFNDTGDFIGGIIAPGVHLSRDALYHAAARLPHVDIKKPKKIVGNATLPAVQSGLYWGYVAMIEGLLERAIQETGFKNACVVATGGLGKLFFQGVDVINHYDGDLTIKGLNMLYERSQGVNL